MDTTKLIEEAEREIAHMKAEALSAANPYNENTIRLTLLIDVVAALKASDERARRAEELAAANLAANKRIVELEHERDAARAELARLTTPRPIAEAPRDGTVVIGCDDKAGPLERLCIGRRGHGPMANLEIIGEHNARALLLATGYTEDRSIISPTAVVR